MEIEVMRCVDLRQVAIDACGVLGWWMAVRPSHQFLRGVTARTTDEVLKMYVQQMVYLHG